MSIGTKLTVQQWGNSLAVRIPAAVARTAHFTVGQPVEIPWLRTACWSSVRVAFSGLS